MVIEREDVRVASSLVRCPFCHADITPDADDWIACRGCMARSHTACWKEAGRCGTCGGVQSLGVQGVQVRSALTVFGSARRGAVVLCGTPFVTFWMSFLTNKLRGCDPIPGALFGALITFSTVLGTATLISFLSNRRQAL
jgi:hypothetical protein